MESWNSRGGMVNSSVSSARGGKPASTNARWGVMNGSIALAPGRSNGECCHLKIPGTTGADGQSERHRRDLLSLRGVSEFRRSGGVWELQASKTHRSESNGGKERAARRSAPGHLSGADAICFRYGESRSLGGLEVSGNSKPPKLPGAKAMANRAQSPTNITESVVP